ncbi:hypothetical protein CLI85_13550 [Tannerella forsythia]|nr:hypothetical protein CLI85_13550 [Tannerella forsythia]
MTANESGVYHVCAHAKFHNDISLAYCRDIYIQVDRKNYRFSLSPNPATDEVTLQLTETDEASGSNVLSTDRTSYEIQLWSGMRMLKSFKTDQPTFSIPTVGLPAGLYFVRVVKDGQTHTQKLIKK